HGSGWRSYIQYDEKQDRPDLDRTLLKRVWSYSVPYRRYLLGILVTVLVISGLGVVPAILIRYIIDDAFVNRDMGLLTVLGAGMRGVPVIGALVGTVRRGWWPGAGRGSSSIFARSSSRICHGCPFASSPLPRPAS